MAGRTLYDKIWDQHVVNVQDDGTTILYIDRHLVHEVTSPQAFEGLRAAGRKVRRPDATIAVADHNVPTTDRSAGIADEESRIQVETLEQNVVEFGVPYFPVDDIRQGIVHIIGPEQGMTLPGMTIVCGDSHTSTHGAFGALAHGIGTSEVEHVLATQTLQQKKSKNMLVKVSGELGFGVTAKDLVLAIIAKIGTAGATGHVIEYAGSAISALSMEGRMTVCNMSIEAGARAGLIAPDETTLAYVKGRPYAPKGAQWEVACETWAKLHTDTDAVFDKVIEINAADVQPTVTGGTSPEQALPVNATIPKRDDAATDGQRQAIDRALNYMDLAEGMPISEIRIDKVFVGSCTNGRIEDLRAAAEVLRGRKVADHVEMLVVPGSGLVKQQAEEEALDEVFVQAGAQWREPGCSMCLAMNADRLEPGERCASTSNRNFEGRQGRGGRTHLVSPAMAAAAAVAGHLTDVRDYMPTQDQ